MSDNNHPPKIDDVLDALRSFLTERGSAYGLQAIGCFGSVARGNANAGSDVDIVYKVTPSARLTLFDLAELREELMQALGRPVDLLEYREGMPPRLQERVGREAIYT